MEQLRRRDGEEDKECVQQQEYILIMYVKEETSSFPMMVKAKSPDCNDLGNAKLSSIEQISSRVGKAREASISWSQIFYFFQFFAQVQMPVYYLV
ncbi:hypothetical protein M9H77_31282 [Catharanthus roseus]|uniref:Uncharacterized protein n=1 Tax=Catharanthus roseus TaxID=4058 RepID=A0ACC0A1H2_CATRO|nr:hypothetical protein M9H77_31282 [Catharanthus roseus]